MLQHNLLLAYRSFVRFKGSFFINLIGLSTGLACSLFIYLWVNDELKMDKFHEKDQRLFQAMERQQAASGILVSDKTSGLVGEVLPKEMPEVEYAASVMHYSWFPKSTLYASEENQLKATGQFASADFFNVFSYGLIQGNAKEALRDKNSVVISRKLASELFENSESVVGKMLTWKMGPFKKPVVVSGVFKDVPFNSSEQFDFLLPFEAWKDIDPGVLAWENNGTNTYVVLKEGASVKQFNKKVAGFITGKSSDSNRKLFLKAYSDKYLYGNYENGEQAGGRIEYVRLFSLVAFFILVIACINFMNLSTAKATCRTKEIGVKKVMGATRGGLIVQHLGESLLLAFMSLVLAVVLVAVLLSPFNQMIGKHLALTLDPTLIAGIVTITLFTGLVAGSYPALYLSGFNPIKVLKGKINSSVGELWIRKGLVVFQFSLSIILIVTVMVVYKQVDYIQTKHLGYDKDNIIYFDKEGRIYENQDAFLAAVKNVPGVINASTIGRSIIGSHNTTGGVSWEGKNPNENTAFEIVRVNYDMIETLGIKMEAGRAFSRNFTTDESKIVFNEAAIKAMGLKDPVGKKVNLWGTDMEIVGVAKNFHFESLHENIKPLFFKLEPRQTHSIAVKIKGGKEKQAMNELQRVYAEFNPGYTWDYKFLDQDYQALYAAEQRVSALSRYFAGLAIVISCLGLFGLATFTADRKRKEIGIRKVFGSSEWSIISHLTGEFTKLVLISILVALPVSYLLTREWLTGFTSSIPLEWWYFIAAGLLALLVAWLTVGLQAVKASRVNPMQTLREE